VSEPKSALLLGVGNILWADEGFGVRCVEAFAGQFNIPDNVVVADGGTQGLYLVDLLREHNPVIIFDAVDFGDAPATMRLVENDDIPAFVGAHKMSLHQAGLQDVIACAKLLGGCASNMLLIGVQPVELEDYGGSLRAEVRACIPRALDIARDYLASFDIELTARTDPASSGVITPGLDIASYESGRPDEAAACRLGDERVLSRVTRD
jgi:hydrogenase maturation protease